MRLSIIKYYNTSDGNLITKVYAHRTKNANGGREQEGSLENPEDIEATNFGQPEYMQGSR